MRKRTSDSVIDRALQLIQPNQEPNHEVRREVVNIIMEIKPTSTFGRGEARKQCRKMAGALRKAVEVLANPLTQALSTRYGEMHKLCEELLTLAEAVEGWGKPKKGRPSKITKRTAAFYAHRLLLRHGDKSPKVYKDGAYFQLAAVLYEGATGIPGADLERACRDMLHEARSRQVLAK
jgi:hypothetical protein